MVKKVDRRQFLAYSSTAIASSLFLKACANSTSQSTPSSSASKQKLAIVLPGSITDGGWNQLGYQGMKKAAEKIGAEFVYVEKVAQADQAEALSEFARQGCRVVAGHGGQFDAAIKQIAAQFPDSFFLAVNGVVFGQNFAAVQTNYNQMFYLAGALGAMMSKTKKLAYISGLEFKATQQHAKAMELGAKSIDPSVQVIASYVGDFNDIAKAKESALALISSGADVIGHNLDNSAPAVLATAQEKGIYAIGNNIDQLDLAPKAVLTSLMQDVGGAVTYVAELAANKTAEGKRYIIGLEKPELVKLGRFNPIVPETAKTKIVSMEKEMLSGKIAFEETEDAGKASVKVVKS